MSVIAGVPSNQGLSTATGSITTTVTNIVQFPAQLYGWYIFNGTAAVAYCQLFNALAANVTLGTTPPFMSLGIPIGAAANLLNPTNGIAFPTAISVAFSTTRTGNTAPASSIDFNFFFY